MVEFKLTPKLQGDMGELIFEHFSEKRGYAYIKLEEIYNTLTPKNILRFRYGYERINAKLPDNIVEEIRAVCKPSNEKEDEPSFVFDYLTVYTNRSFKKIDGKWVQKDSIDLSNLFWVEIKTGKSKLSANQKRTKKNVKLRFCVFRINTEFPETISIKWEE